MNIEQAYIKHEQDIFRYFKHKTHSIELAEDLTHDTFIKISDNDLKDETIKGYIYYVAQSIFLDHLRNNHIETLDYYDIEEIADESYKEHINFEDILKPIKDDKLKELLRLKYVENMGLYEIAQTLDISERTAKRWHKKAKQIIKENFKY